MQTTLSLKNQLALGTTLLIAGAGYVRRTYAQCAVTTSPNFVCAGSNSTSQTVNAPGAQVTTAPGFSVVTSAGNGVSVSGNNSVSFSDANASTITGAATGLSVIAPGGDGDITITTSGAIEGQSGEGIHAESPNLGGIGNLTISTSGPVTGATDGIYVENRRIGPTAITVAANVTATSGSGVRVVIPTAGLLIRTEAGTNVTGGINGLDVTTHYGAEDWNIEINGDSLVGLTGAGILFHRAAYTDNANLTLTTAIGTEIIGQTDGISIQSQGIRNGLITVNGPVTGTTGYGIFARHETFDFSSPYLGRVDKAEPDFD